MVYMNAKAKFLRLTTIKCFYCRQLFVEEYRQAGGFYYCCSTCARRVNMAVSVQSMGEPSGIVYYLDLIQSERPKRYERRVKT